MTYASRVLEDDLRETAQRMDFDGGELLCRDAICMGDWVLMAALGHTEAGQLHALGGRPNRTYLGEYPWKIQVVQASAMEEERHTESDSHGSIPEDVMETIRTSLQFRYPHMAATRAPSKQTATGRKGRLKDAEAAENTGEQIPVTRSWRRPSFLTDRVEGKTVGNAMHSAMQYLRYGNCGLEEDVQDEIRRLVQKGFLTEEQGQLVDCKRIAQFFATEPGTKLRKGTPHLREFKFSILDKGEHYGEGLEGEAVLLQGVVDCALLEADGITVLDFKTDYVTEDTVEERAAYYRPQLEAYSEALCRIYEMPLKARYLYFFRLNRFVEC